MQAEARHITVPRYYSPRPYQIDAWKRRADPDIWLYIKLWGRQLGKDTDDIQHSLRNAWDHPGTQTAYVGLNNKWINDNIFKKYIDNRTHWEDYPENLIDPKDTQKEVYMLNNPDGVAPARIKFIGFQNEDGMIGSSYETFYVSEGSLYRRNAFAYITPIWERKLKEGTLHVNFNGTPRGQKNVFYDLIRTYTGVDDPADFPGLHVDKFGRKVYVDKVTIEDATRFDEHGNIVPIYSKDEIEFLRYQSIRAYGNDALFRQENYCDFTVVNAGLVYRGIETLINEGRYCPMNIDSHKPVYIAWDIASKGKSTDASAAIVFQYYNNRMVIVDIAEYRGISLVEAMGEMAKREYFSQIRMGFLPWDSDRSASSQTPIEECRATFPGITWHSLDKERVDRGINLVREQLPNMVIDSRRCDWLIECFNNYEFKRLEKQDDWAPKPAHNKYSHMMDALRYAVMGIKEIAYYNLNEDGSDRIDWDLSYEGMNDDNRDGGISIPGTILPREKKTKGGLYYYG